MKLLLNKYIVHDPKVLGGKPVIKGTRISVEFVLELIRSGMSFDDILKDYPHLSNASLAAAIAFAKHAVSREEVISIESAVVA